MDDQRFGSALRAVRQRRRWRQRDVADRAGLSQSTVSRAERGHLATLSLGAIRAAAAVLDVRADLVARSRAGDLDRLLNARHSLFQETVATSLARYPGRTFAPEASFPVYGERGVVDLVGWHEMHRALLLIELKRDVADVNELIGTFDRKLRLGGSIARDRGWRPSTFRGWIIVSPGRTNRARVAAHGRVLRAAFPNDGRTMGTWLRRPDGRRAALSIWRNAGSGHPTTELAPVRRVRPLRGVRPLRRVRPQPATAA